MLCVSLLSGCVPRIEVATPKDPITINMNVKIEHEIHIKVDKDVENRIPHQRTVTEYPYRAVIRPAR